MMLRGPQGARNEFLPYAEHLLSPYALAQGACALVLQCSPVEKFKRGFTVDCFKCR